MEQQLANGIGTCFLTHGHYDLVFVALKRGEEINSLTANEANVRESVRRKTTAMVSGLAKIGMEDRYKILSYLTGNVCRLIKTQRCSAMQSTHCVSRHHASYIAHICSYIILTSTDFVNCKQFS